MINSETGNSETRCDLKRDSRQLIIHLQKTLWNCAS